MRDHRERFDLTGRVVLVTGASQGLGRGLALGLAAAGADLILSSRREELLKEVKAEIEALGRRAEVFAFDVRDVASIEELKAFSLDRFGRVDVLVNSAGYAENVDSWLFTECNWDRMVDTGLKGLFFCCQIIGSIMRDHRYGKIINLSSTFSRSVSHGTAGYAAMKAAVSHLTEALAVEWAPCGIRVNAIAPTATMTPTRMHRFTPERTQMLIDRIPLGRLGTVDDLIPAAIYLASEASDFVTGQTLFVDGGWVARG